MAERKRDDPLSEIHRDLARLETHVEVFREDLAETKVMVNQLRDTMMRATGGWKVIVAVAAGGVTLGAALMKSLLM